jgi:hypothetical protein
MFGLKYYEGANSGKRKRELVKIDDEKNQKNRKNMKQKERECFATVGQKTESG